MTKRMPAALVAAFIFMTILMVPSTAQAAWYDGRNRDDLFIAATAAETQLGWGKYAPPAINQTTSSCVAAATASALRMLLVKNHGWTKDTQWRLDVNYVYNTVGKNPHNVAVYTNDPGYPVHGTHPNMFVTAFNSEVTADQAGITNALNTMPVAFAVRVERLSGSHEVAAVYADPVKGVLIQNSWGSSWLGTGFAWVEWQHVSRYIGQDWSHGFWGVDGYRP